MHLVYVTFSASESGITNGDTLPYSRIVSSMAHQYSVQNRQGNTAQQFRPAFAGRKQGPLPTGRSVVFHNE